VSKIDRNPIKKKPSAPDYAVISTQNAEFNAIKEAKESLIANKLETVQKQNTEAAVMKEGEVTCSDVTLSADSKHFVVASDETATNPTATLSGTDIITRAEDTNTLGVAVSATFHILLSKKLY